MERVNIGPCHADLDRRGARSRVIILPGARYSTQAPLLWFSRELALSRGADVLSVRDEPPATGDPFAWARERALRALEYEPIEPSIVVGKSIASAATGLIAQRNLAAAWITPLLNQASVVDGLAQASAPTMLLGGTADPTWTPHALAPSPQITIVELPGLDHSLQIPGDPAGSLRALTHAVSAIDRFLTAALP